MKSKDYQVTEKIQASQKRLNGDREKIRDRWKLKSSLKLDFELTK